MELAKKKKRCALVLVVDVFCCLIQHKTIAWVLRATRLLYSKFKQIINSSFILLQEIWKKNLNFFPYLEQANIGRLTSTIVSYVFLRDWTPQQMFKNKISPIFILRKNKMHQIGCIECQLNKSITIGYFW